MASVQAGIEIRAATAERAIREPTTAEFAALFDAHANAVYNFCFRRTGVWALAEDLTSVVFLEAWRRRRDVDLVNEPPRPWLLGVATNLLRNHHRSLRRHRAALERLPRSDSTPDHAEELAERMDAERQMGEILEVIDRLPRREREVLALCVWGEVSYEEAARALRIPVGTVRSRLARARTHLAAMVGEGDAESLAGDLNGGSDDA
jgi:RNA polymerase sigma-70 factor, ECF subfamily